MSDTLYRYYEEELVGFHRQAQDFRAKYPAAAGQLRLGSNQSADPHVERLIQSFSFLNARIRKKLDDDFPELTDALLSILYPHYIAPVPSIATVQLQPESSNLQPTGLEVPRHSGLRTAPVDGVPCRFRTCYPVKLWPVEISSTQVYTAPFPDWIHLPTGCSAMMSITLQATGGHSFAGLDLQQLRFHLNGDQQFVAKLYQLIFNDTVSVEFCDPGDEKNRIALNPDNYLSQVGFSADEALLPYPKNSFVGYQLLTELFSYPQKFAYFDLGGFAETRRFSLARELQIRFYLKSTPDRFETELTKDAFKLGCTPIVNLFKKICEPISLTQKKFKYRVTPDVHHPESFEVYSIDRLECADPHNQKIYHPFYSFQKPLNKDGTETFWYASRVESQLPNDHGSDNYLHLVDPDFDPTVPAEAAMTVTATCTNRDLPIQLQQSHVPIDFTFDSAIPLKKVECLSAPSTPLRSSLRRRAHWKLISHLTLNHLSIANTEDALDSLKQILHLYDFSSRESCSRLAALNQQMVEGIKSIQSRRVTRRIGNNCDGAFCCGMQIEINLDEDKYIGVGAFLFSSVLRHFFTKYSSINSFVELLVKTEQRNEPLRHWPHLLGEEQVL